MLNKNILIYSCTLTLAMTTDQKPLLRPPPSASPVLCLIPTVYLEKLTGPDQPSNQPNLGGPELDLVT